MFLLFRHVNPYYWTSQLVQLDIRQVLCLLAVVCVLYLPTRSIVMENIGNNLILKCKTKKMSFLYAPKHKHMTRTPLLEARGAPTQVPSTAATAHNASSQERALRVFCGAPMPPAPCEAKKCSGPRPPDQGRAVGGGRVPNPGRPSRRQETPPPGALLPPPGRATPPRKSVRCDIGDGPSRPHPLRPRKRGQRAPVARPEDGLSGEGECPAPENLSRPTGNRKGDMRTESRPPPPPHQREAEQGTQAGNTKRH